VYLQHSKFPEALAIAIRMNDRDLIRSDFNASANPCVATSRLVHLSL
jgi:26S proteasome regulatory subunit N1